MPGTSEEDYRLPLDKTGEQLVDPSGGSLVYYQAEGPASVATLVNFIQGKESWVGSSENVKELKATLNSLMVERLSAQDGKVHTSSDKKWVCIKYVGRSLEKTCGIGPSQAKCKGFGAEEDSRTL